MAKPPATRKPAGPDEELDEAVLSGQAQGRLRTIVQRLERLAEDKQAVADDMKEVFAEAKGEGYDTKILRKVLAIRKMDPAKRAEEEALIDTYRIALGDLQGL